ncbi:hypothetical protein [Ectopseudomonas khazarica]|uniref:hypothetical protein n=1 Tax=Ectopseudomonas khazarica TaxID=2502979 RepID=UPI002FE11616
MKPDIEKSDQIGIPAANLGAFIKATEVTAQRYRRRYAKQEDREWDTGAANLIGGTVGAIGAVAHSIPAAGFGALTVGTAGIVSNFYGVEKQNDAYTKAAAGTQCLGTLAENIYKPAALSKFLSPDASVAAEDFALARLNKAMQRIEDKLIERLRKRAVSTSPDFTAFETYLKARLDAGKAPKNAAAVAGVTRAEKAAEEQIASAIARLDADIGVCLTTF